MKKAALLSLLREVSIFADLDDDARERVLAEATRRRLKAGEWLFRQRGRGDALYLVCAGRLEVIREDGLTPKLLAVLGPGECVGELAVLCELPRSASVRARRDAELLELSRDTFNRMMLADTRLAVQMTRVLAQRLHRTSTRGDDHLRRRMRVLSLVALHPGLPLGEVRDTLVSYFSDYGKTAVLDGTEVDTEGLDAEAADAAYAELLDRAEGGHDTVILLSRPGPVDPRWARFCLRQGDRRVLLAFSTAPPSIALAFTATDGADLALFGPSSHDESVGRWLAAIEPNAHHLVADNDRAAGLQRLARRVSGRAVGLVLSGGGARGFAHIGVIRALAEAGVVIDRVGGTSMGALVGALYALGLSPDEMLATCDRDLDSPFDDYTLPILSLTRARKALRLLRRIFGERRIEDLAIPSFFVSADLLTARPYIHRAGPIAEAIACSAALPGLAPPRRFDDALLVDGALLNNLPTDIMAATHEGPVIASDVMAKRDHPSETGLLPGTRPPARWIQQLTRVLGNQPGPLPTIVQTLMRASVLGAVSAAVTQRALADVVITPPVSHIGLLEFTRGSELVQVGYDAARAALAEAGTLNR